MDVITEIKKISIFNFNFDSQLIVISFIIICIIYHVFWCNQLPPGPKGLPIFGYWPLLKDETCHLVMEKWQNKYGDLFSFNYAGTLYINMGNAKTIREIVIKTDCFERCTKFSLLPHVFANGLGFANGEPWKVLRKFTLQQFKELGIATLKQNASKPMHDSVKETIVFLRSIKGKPVDILQLMTDKCNAIFRHTFFGENGISEQEIQDTCEAFNILLAFMTVQATNILLAGNFPKYFIFPFKRGFKSAIQHHENIVKIMTKVVNRHKSTFDIENPRNFIDNFLKENIERQSRNDPSAQHFNDTALISTLVQFVGDGVLSVAAYVAAFLKYVLDNEEEQDKIYAELMEVVGQERLPTLEDKQKMIYTNALILEIMRTTDFLTIFPSLQCIKETTIQGYKIPEGSLMLLNVWTCHQDPQVYDEPKKFDPSRFISKDGQQKSELPVTFGIGKRACIGDHFTMAQVFLFLTSIIQNFKLKVPQNNENKMFDIITTAKLQVCALPR